MLVGFDGSVHSNRRNFDIQSCFPPCLVAGTEYLEFHASTPSASGSLQTQARIALRMLLRNHQGAKIVKLRVFAVGTDLSAVEQIVSTTFTSKKRPLRVLSLIGVAGFPKPGQRLVVESVAVGKKRINPFGVAFLAGVQSHAVTKPSVASHKWPGGLVLPCQT